MAHVGTFECHLSWGHLQRVFVDQLPGTSFSQSPAGPFLLSRAQNEARKGLQDHPVQPSLHRTALAEGPKALPPQQHSLGFGFFPVCPIDCDGEGDNGGMGSGHHQAWGHLGTPGMGQSCGMSWALGAGHSWPGGSHRALSAVLASGTAQPPRPGVTDCTPAAAEL